MPHPSPPRHHRPPHNDSPLGCRAEVWPPPTPTSSAPPSCSHCSKAICCWCRGADNGFFHLSLCSTKGAEALIEPQRADGRSTGGFLHLQHKRHRVWQGGPGFNSSSWYDAQTEGLFKLWQRENSEQTLFLKARSVGAGDIIHLPSNAILLSIVHKKKNNDVTQCVPFILELNCRGITIIYSAGVWASVCAKQFSVLPWCKVQGWSMSEEKEKKKEKEPTSSKKKAAINREFQEFNFKYGFITTGSSYAPSLCCIIHG